MTMKCLIKRMFGEKEDFYAYIMMAQEEKDPAKKTTFLKLAEGEGDDYKTIYDMVFAEAATTDREQGLHEYAKEAYEDMKEKIKEFHTEAK